MNFIENITSEIGEEIDLLKLNQVIKDAEKQFLSVTVKKRLDKENEVEPMWINDGIKKEIAKRRIICKNRRKENNPELKLAFKEEFDKQKYKVQTLVNEAIESHEIKATNKIKNDPNRSKKLFQHIDILKRINKTKKKDINIYDDEGNIIEDNDIGHELQCCWNPIYNCNDNKILTEWNDESKASYISYFTENTNCRGQYVNSISLVNGNLEYDYNEIEFSRDLLDHYETVLTNIYIPLSKMTDPIIKNSEVKEQLKKIKNGKAPGPDSIKPELYKYILQNENLINLLTMLLNNILDTQMFPDQWKTSNTVLINKNPRPKIHEFRPIALTNISYKLLMGILKNKIMTHLKQNDAINDFQTGATQGRRVTENIFIFNYCIEKSYIRKKSLYALSIDFSKAFDSIDRYEIIKILKELHVHPKIINLVAKIYSNDSTSLFLNNNKYLDVNISSGIRQGCNLSAVLFILATYKIIDSIHSMKYGYRDENIQISSLFYMDDAIILAENKTEIEKLLFKIEIVSMKYGLKLNRSKCNIMIFNNKDKEENICGINVVSKIKYLGIFIDDKKKCFNSHKDKVIEDAIKFSNQLYSVLGNAVNRLLIGKTFWKSLVLTNILYGNDIIVYNVAELKRLQIIENKAFRSILQVPTYTATEFLRGEIGASSFKSRDIKNKVTFIKHALNSSNMLLKEIMTLEFEIPSTIWMKETLKYMSEVNLSKNEIINESSNKIINKIYKWDEDFWRSEMEKKSTLTIYKNKDNIKEVKWFRNGLKYNIMMKARSNTLDLRWREWATNEEKICKLCNKQIETLQHFLLDCDNLQSCRNKYIELQLPRIEDNLAIIIKILLLGKETKINEIYFIDMLHDMWVNRKKLLSHIQNQVS